ncbi:DNA-binding NarL/FixJ family response regulator [Crossiella equi]|uniref:DNA-binding NarL/FixJ family response regulator n=1 Tax=Crossiella equi TaxID=130796 RepID=A0ABS5A6U4_9PSEU|nr:LuxR C-terminal-related transcriptional regulator [Crossiella equi]MBP2472319.1 DNA-binding NarL/FixJ family response regulator [Crossiella equi]
MSVVTIAAADSSASSTTTQRERLAVAVHTGDQRLAADLMPVLALSPDLRLLPATESALADIVLVLAEIVTDALLIELDGLSARAVNKAQRFVLVAGPLRERHLARIFGAGVVSILPRREVSPRMVVRALVASHQGHAVLPERLTRWLVDETRFVQTNLLATQGLTVGGLTVREVEVIKLIAKGEETAAIAAQLNYSERTIKKIVKDLLSRLELRNRAHAVSYALRVGAI